MARQLSQRTTSSGAAVRAADSSLPDSSMWQASQRRARSSAFIDEASGDKG